jgi:hypothetical protein
VPERDARKSGEAMSASNHPGVLGHDGLTRPGVALDTSACPFNECQIRRMCTRPGAVGCQKPERPEETASDRDAWRRRYALAEAGAESLETILAIKRAHPDEPLDHRLRRVFMFVVVQRDALANASRSRDRWKAKAKRMETKAAKLAHERDVLSDQVSEAIRDRDARPSPSVALEGTMSGAFARKRMRDVLQAWDERQVETKPAKRRAPSGVRFADGSKATSTIPRRDALPSWCTEGVTGKVKRRPNRKGGR